jgi:hypothetical protein
MKVMRSGSHNDPSADRGGAVKARIRRILGRRKLGRDNARTFHNARHYGCMCLFAVLLVIHTVLFQYGYTGVCLFLLAIMFVIEFQYGYLHRSLVLAYRIELMYAGYCILRG